MNKKSDVNISTVDLNADTISLNIYYPQIHPVLMKLNETNKVFSTIENK